MIFYIYNECTTFAAKPSQLESSPKKKWPSGHSGHNELGIRSPDQVKISPHKKAPEKSSQRNSLKGMH